MIIESLEQRALLAGDWQNADLPCDVNQSGLVSSLDALIVINKLSRSGPRILELGDSLSMLLDTNGDGLLSSSDALHVINLLQRYRDPAWLSAVIQGGDQDGNGVIASESVMIVGATTRGAKIDLKVNGELKTKLQTDHDGRFSFVADLNMGTNAIVVTGRDPIGRTAVQELSVVRGDIVSNWNASILNVVRSWTSASDDPYEGRIVTSEPPKVARNLAMIHTAMFDAINAVDETYEPYLQSLPTPLADISEIAAGAMAAHTVASAIYGDADELAVWDATLAESLDSVSDEDAKQRGIEYGRIVGQAMLMEREQDGSSGQSIYVSGTQPGNWNRTYPDFNPPLLPHWSNVAPFTLTNIDDFLPPPPPELSSQAYAEAVDEVMQIGSLSSEHRTADQTEIAVFWADGGGTATPPGHWNRIATDVGMKRGLTLVENARLFAMLNLAMADAGIAAWDAKYTYDLWRPIDAIREADSDGNPLTTQDETWLSLLRTPPFPTYTSGHSTFSGAADAVLTALLGDSVSFTSTSDPQNAFSQRPLDPSRIVSRDFGSFHEAAEEAGISRVYGGIHFDIDNTAGLAIGRSIGEFVANRILLLR